MDDKLKKFIEDNREAFDSADPRPELLKKLRQQLRQDPQPVKLSMYKIVAWAAVAAGIIIFTVVLYYSLQQNSHSTQIPVAKTESGNENLPVTDPVYAKQIGYYQELIGLQQTQLRQIGKDQPELYDQFTRDMNTLDSAYVLLKTKLAEKTNTELLLETMIQNLQLQTELLNRQLLIIKTIKQKNKPHEKNTI
ncbi:MAG TPA: hypothetical protein VFI06_13735 [Chitinophagaceae bacterium]|nr:hypothetical protein [Chitinophagaceae bacterium]